MGCNGPCLFDLLLGLGALARSPLRWYPTKNPRGYQPATKCLPGPYARSAAGLLLGLSMLP